MQFIKCNWESKELIILSPLGSTFPCPNDRQLRQQAAVSFSGMKKNAASFSAFYKDGKCSLLLKVVVGDWKNYFTPLRTEREI